MTPAGTPTQIGGVSHALRACMLSDAWLAQSRVGMILLKSHPQCTLAAACEQAPASPSTGVLDKNVKRPERPT